MENKTNNMEILRNLQQLDFLENLQTRWKFLFSNTKESAITQKMKKTGIS